MSIHEQFELLAQQWADHCRRVRYSSNLAKYLDHPAYRRLVDLGPTIIPYVLQTYRSDELPWGFVLQELTGEKMIDNRNAFNPDEVRKRWLAWWEARQTSGANGTAPGAEPAMGPLPTSFRS